MECVGAGISGGGPPWAHEAGGAPYKGGRALDPHGQVLAPLLCSQCLKSSNILEKDHTKLTGHLENFYFQEIFYFMDNSENRQKILFLLYLI